MERMKIHGICLIKNEEDIAGYFLGESRRWCDFIYVLDTGSTDGTWEIVQEAAREFPQIIPFRKASIPFDDQLRADVFNEYRGRAGTGDWWCRLDADEIYIDDPREFLSRAPKSCHVVWTAHLQYYFTERDLERLGESPVIPTMTAENLPVYYDANASEGRFFRHRAGLQWPGGAWPRHLGLVYPKRIRVKHFQYRSPGQIQSRLDTRRQAAASGWKHFEHSLEKDWREKIVPSSGLTLDEGNGHYVIDETRMPRHLESAPARLVKRVMHGAALWP
jgi:glycosyltransferase involved in cell wall biosynthesis